MTDDGGRWYRRFGACLLLIMLLIMLPVVGLILVTDCWQVKDALTAGEIGRASCRERV